ncbi:MAG: TIGR03905 family TSCPD domain-containing protein [Rikenellaceae bacterium]|nr:TIGR03905 family TSCPD domain-containing protein [Rikenellaceae bacterium]
MQKISYTPNGGVCSRRIDVELNGDRIRHVTFTGGCAGNSQGVAALLKGMTVDEAIARLSGIRCGSKLTSCPDQLACALREAQASDH